MSDRIERRGSRDRDEDRRGSRDRDDDRGSRRSRDSDDDRRSSRGRDDDRGSSRSSGGRRFEYRERAADETKRRSTQGANEYDKILKGSIKMWKPNDGENRIRILPPTWEDAKHFGLDIYVHYGVGPDRGTYLCLSKMKGEDDPIEEERLAARKDGDEEYAKELEAKRRVLVYVIDRDHEKEGVQAWAMPWTLDRDIVKVSVDRSSGEVLPIDHPEEGYDVEFEKKGSKNRTEYLGVAIARRSSPLGRDEWLEYAMDNPLPDQLQFFDYDHIAKAFGGGGAHKERSRDRGDDRDDDRRGSSSRDRDRDEKPDRQSRDRDDDRSSSSRGRERDRDEPSRGREASRSQDQDLTWDSIHGMTMDELEDLIDQEKLDINPAKADGEDDLADWICEELDIKKPKAESTRRQVKSDDHAEESASDRLRRMRERRD